jgi:hypothetical protein
MRYDLQGQKIRLGALLAFIPTLLAGPGCISKGSQEQTAPPTAHTLSASQEREMTAALMSAAALTPPSDVPLELLPEHGIRWGDLRRAMDKAAEANGLAVLEETAIDEDHVAFTLISPEGWPARVSVTRLNAAPWVAAESRVGPYPHMPYMQRRAAELNTAFLDWMSAFGRMRRVPSIY